MVFKNIYANIITGSANLITKGIEKVTGKTYGRTTAKEFSESKVGSKILTGTELATFSLIGAGVASKVATSVKAVGATQTAKNIATATLSKSGGKKALGVLAGYTAINVVTANPKIVTEQIPKAITAVGATGSDIGEYSKNPTLSGAKDLIIAHPYIATLTGASLIAVVGVKGASIISNYLNTRAVQQNTAEYAKDKVKEVKPENYTQQQSPVIIQNYIPAVAPATPAPLNPELAVEQTKAKPKKKSKKKKKKRKVAKKRKSKKKPKKKKRKKYKKRRKQ